LGLAEVFQKYQQSIKNHDTFKMYQYHDTILNQVSVSRYNLEVSYPTLRVYRPKSFVSKALELTMGHFHFVTRDPCNPSLS